MPNFSKGSPISKYKDKQQKNLQKILLIIQFLSNQSAIISNFLLLENLMIWSSKIKSWLLLLKMLKNSLDRWKKYMRKRFLRSESKKCW